MEKIRIVYLVTFIKNVGVYNVVSNLLNKIDTKKYEVTIISFLNSNDENEIKRIENLGIRHISLKLKNKIEVVIKGISKLKQQLNILKPDIVHSNAIISDCALSKIKGNFKKITTIHCNLCEDYEYTYGKIVAKIFLCIHLKALKKFDTIVGCSKSVYELSLKNKFKNSMYITNGVKRNDINESNSRFIRNKLKLTDNNIIYIYVGNLSNGKNIDYLINEFKKYHLPNEHLIVIGKGKLFKKCKEIADANIHILGFINNPGDYIKDSDVYVSASKSEGMSLSIIEAIERGLLLLLSSIPSHREMFDNCKGLYLGETFDENNFEDAIKKIRKKVKSRDREKIIKYKNDNFSPEVMYKNYEKLYIKLYNNKN